LQIETTRIIQIRDERKCCQVTRYFKMYFKYCTSQMKRKHFHTVITGDLFI